MRILKHPRLEQAINLSGKEFYSIIIENQSFLRTFLYQLESDVNGVEDNFLYRDGEKELKLSKDAFIVWNPLKPEIDERKLDTIIQKDVAIHITPNQAEEYQLLLQKINEYINSLSYSYPIPLSFQSELTLQSFLKAMALSPSEEPENYLERLVFQIKKIAFGFGFKIFFFLNLHDFLSKSEMELFIKELRLLELSPIFILSHKSNYKIDSEYRILIDEDLCELNI